nr:MAG TPA: hypothetical protein [Caudoviricetes sp.]DAY64664.1 MAG TPA: hypothetical protein [Caudoviricetes sp.]
MIGRVLRCLNKEVVSNLSVLMTWSEGISLGSSQ